MSKRATENRMIHQAVYQPVESLCLTSAISIVAKSITVGVEGFIENLPLQQLGTIQRTIRQGSKASLQSTTPQSSQIRGSRESTFFIIQGVYNLTFKVEQILEVFYLKKLF